MNLQGEVSYKSLLEERESRREREKVKLYCIIVLNLRVTNVYIDEHKKLEICDTCHTLIS